MATRQQRQYTVKMQFNIVNWDYRQSCNSLQTVGEKLVCKQSSYRLAGPVALARLSSLTPHSWGVRLVDRQRRQLLHQAISIQLILFLFE